MQSRFCTQAMRRSVHGALLASAFLLVATTCPAQVGVFGSESNETHTTVRLPKTEHASSDMPTLHVVSSMPLPELWKKMGSSEQVSCNKNGDLLFQLISTGPDYMPHEIARVGANGAMLGYFDLHQTPGFEKARIYRATFDSASRIVLLVHNITATDVLRTDAEGNPHTVRIYEDHTRWVLTVDDNGKILQKFGFKDSVTTGPNFAVFTNGNVLVNGFVEATQSVVIFSPDGAVLARFPIPNDLLEDQQAAANSAPANAAAAARSRPPLMGDGSFTPIAGDGEIYLVRREDQRLLRKVSADGSLGPKVKLAIPDDQRAYVMRIAGHRALVAITSPQKPGTVVKRPDWVPMAVFDTESGALLETMLSPQDEASAVCYSGSGIKTIRSPAGTLDTLEIGTQ